MPWLARHKMALAGHQVSRGDLVPQTVVDEIPSTRFAQLLRTGLLQEISDAEASEILERRKAEAKNQPDPDADQMCPICDGGPYRRLAQHMAQKHRTDGDSA